MMRLCTKTAEGEGDERRGLMGPTQTESSKNTTQHVHLDDFDKQIHLLDLIIERNGPTDLKKL